MRDLHPTLQIFLLLNHSKLSHFIRLFFLILLLEVLRSPHVFTSKRALDLLAHFLTENRQRFYDDLDVVSG